MKNIVYASALVLAGVTGVAAADIEATEQNLIAIQQYVPEATMGDLQAMSDTDIRVILNAISSAGSESEVDERVNGLFMSADRSDTGTMTNDFANETNLAKIRQYVPEATMAQLEAMDDNEIASVINAMNSVDSEPEAADRVRALFGHDSGEMNPNATSDFVNETNLAKIQQYAPDVTMADLTRIGDETIAVLLNRINGSEGEGDKRSAIRAAFE